MAPTTKKWIDKKAAQTFQVRYRSQADPLIHDDEATDIVLTQVDAPNTKPSDKIKSSATLASELGVQASSVRPNEGEAAMHGVYYDDTSYDYMQHLRDMGESHEAVFIEAPQADNIQRKNRHDRPKKQTFEEALADEIAPKNTVIRIPRELLASEVQVKRTYQDQQDIPDALTGFQPDMDPRLREVLEALEDDAYVDDDEDLFGALAEGGEATQWEFEETYGEFEEEEDDGWGSDTTEKAETQVQTTDAKEVRPATEEEGSDAWMKEFSKFKKAQKKMPKDEDVESSMPDTQSTMSFGSSMMSIGGTMSVSNRRRKREKKAGKAMTEVSSYSMSSSALFRTEGLTLLDDRFDKIESMYNEDSDEEELTAPVPETRKDFDSIMDEFLGSYSTTGSTPASCRVKRGAQLTPMQQLDEVRRELGKARIR